jgi:zinc transporter ZupT
MWIASFILFLIAIAGAFVYDRFGTLLRSQLNLILAFGGAFLIGIIFNHLVPEAYAMNRNAGYVVVFGFLLQGALEYLSQGVEHGHAHHHEAKNAQGNMPWAMYFSLCLHAFIESMPLSAPEHQGHHEHVHHDHSGHVHLTGIESIDSTLLVGLILHKFPVALVLMSMLDAFGVSRGKQWAGLVFFGLTPMLGMLFYNGLLQSNESWTAVLPEYAGGLLIGILLHISTTILFETGDGHRFNRNKMLVTIGGLALAFLVTA